MTSTRFTVLTTFLSATLFSLGCSSGPAPQDYGPTGSVTGELMSGGNPLDEGTSVTFYMKKQGHSSTALIDSEGKFSLTSFNNGQLPIGEYVVVITPPPAPELTDEELLEGKHPEAPDVFYSSTLSSPDTTSLMQIVNEGENHFVIEVPAG